MFIPRNFGTQTLKIAFRLVSRKNHEDIWDQMTAVLQIIKSEITRNDSEDEMI